MHISKNLMNIKIKKFFIRIIYRLITKLYQSSSTFFENILDMINNLIFPVFAITFISKG